MTNSPNRKTAWIVGGLLIALGAWNVHRGRMTVAEVLSGVGTLLLLIGTFLPGLAEQFHNVWMRLAVVLGYVNSRILLSGLFFAVLAPVGVVRRMIGHDPLSRRGPSRDSYWIPRPDPAQPRDQFERLF